MIDVLIIGSGPAGLSAAIYCVRAGLTCEVIEKDAYGIGQIAKSDQIDNYLGIPGINGYELGMKYREHATSIGVCFVKANACGYNHNPDSGIWSVSFEDGTVKEARTIIYAAGANHRALGIEGEDELIGMGVSYCATCDGAFFRGKDVAVIGGGNTALGDALYMANLANKVYLVHRRASFRGSISTVEQLRQKDNVEFVLNATPGQIEGTDCVEALILEDGRKLVVDGIFVAVGMKPVTDSLTGVVDLDTNGYVVADETGVTSAKGFFVAGDVRTKALRQIVTAVSDGANAATSADEYIRTTYAKS